MSDQTPTLLTKPARVSVRKLGIPLMAAGLFQAGFNFTEVAIFGRVMDQGASMAGAAVSDLVTSLFVFLATGLGNAAVANISYAHGAGDLVRECRHIRQALVVGFLLSILSLLVGFFADPIGQLLMGDDPARGPGTEFLRIMAFGGFGTIYMIIAIAILRARGDTLRPLVLVAVVSLATLGLEAVYILGLFGVEPHGIGAAAWITVILRGLTGLWGVLWIARKVPLIPPKGERFVHVAALRNQITLGFVSALQLSARAIGMLALVGLAANRLSPLDGGTTFTALNIWIKVDTPTLLLAFAWGGGVAPLVGMSLGAKRPAYARQTAWYGVAYVAFFSMITMLAVFLFAEPIVAALIPDATQVVPVAGDCLRHVAPTYCLLTAGIVIVHAYNGAGDMRTPLLWDVAILIGVQTLLAYVLGSPDAMAASGMFMALTISGVLQGAVPMWLLRRARWHRAFV